MNFIRKCSSHGKLLLVLIIFFLAEAQISHAQKHASSLVFAVTGDVKGSTSWNMIRLIDFSNGEEKELILNGATAGLPIYDARDSRQLLAAELTAMQAHQIHPSAMSAGVAAMAYDKKHNRLYFTPLQTDQLKYIDLNHEQRRIFVVTGQHFSAEGMVKKEDDMITRMAIGADGNGYALTNDGNHLLKFTTSKDPEITDLGPLMDDDRNGSASIHNRCTGWGGDIICDAFNNLYLFTNGNAVFKIDIRNRKAYLLGSISGLPAGFTTNGAAVLDDGSLVIASAYSTGGYYELDLSTLHAQKINSEGTIFNASDLATGNLAFDRLATEQPNHFRIPDPEPGISIFPNPVSERRFRVSFDNNPPGDYEVQVMNSLGVQTLLKKVSISFRNQVEELRLPASSAKGVYLLKVMDAARKTIFVTKVMVQ